MHCQSNVIWVVNYCQQFVLPVTPHSLRDVYNMACQFATSESEPLLHEACNHRF